MLPQAEWAELGRISGKSTSSLDMEGTMLDI
jgi:hypothetical protein